MYAEHIVYHSLGSFCARWAHRVMVWAAVMYAGHSVYHSLNSFLVCRAHCVLWPEQLPCMQGTLCTMAWAASVLLPFFFCRTPLPNSTLSDASTFQCPHFHVTCCCLCDWTQRPDYRAVEANVRKLSLFQIYSSGTWPGEMTLDKRWKNPWWNSPEIATLPTGATLICKNVCLA